MKQEFPHACLFDKQYAQALLSREFTPMSYMSLLMRSIKGQQYRNAGPTWTGLEDPAGCWCHAS